MSIVRAMSDPARRRPSTNPVQRALAHPLRARLVALLERAPASPSQLAAQVDAPVGVVSYHVRVLAGAGVVELVATAPKRGALQHFYALRERADTLGATLLLEPDDAGALMSDLRARVDEARRTAADAPGDVPVTVVVHAG